MAGLGSCFDHGAKSFLNEMAIGWEEKGGVEDNIKVLAWSTG